MTKQSVPAKALVVVGTGEGATFFRNMGDAGNIELKNVGNLSPGDLADEGPSGKSPPEQSAKESMEATFSKQLAQFLYDKAHAGDYDSLVLVLDPDTLGEVRPLLHKEVTDRMAMELDKTLVNHSTADIERSLKAATT